MAISTTFTLKFAGAAVERGLARVTSGFRSLGGVAMRAGRMLLSPFAALTAMLGTGALVAGLVSFVKGSSAAASSVESLTTQFTTLLSSASAAKERMEEITEFAAKTPFEIQELAATSKLLEVMGGKLISTGDGLRLVGDAAAMAGQPLQEVGLQIGRVFSAITSGTSAGESVNRLQELGLITGSTKLEFEKLAAAQKKGTKDVLSQANALTLLQTVMSKAKGGMEALSATTEGKLSNIKDNLDQLKVAFGTGFNDGLKIALDAANTKLPQLMAKLAEFGTLIGKTISDAVNGDLTRFFMIGELIGEAISAGIEVSVRSLGGKISDFLGDKAKFVNLPAFLLDKAVQEAVAKNPELGKQLKIAEEKVIKQDQDERSKALQIRVDELSKGIQQKYGEALALPTALPQKSGAHPRMQGISYARPNDVSNMFDEEGHRIIFDIKKGIDALNQKLAPQP